MKSKLFNNLLLYSLFGVSLGFFGVLYEGVVIGPKMLDHSANRLLFWKDFYAIISPIVYYIPVVPSATLLLLVLYFNTSREKIELKKELKLASILQVSSLLMTLYIVTQINLKSAFSSPDQHATEIPFKVILFNILSVIRIVLTAMGLRSIFRAYIQNERFIGKNAEVGMSIAE
ncbi:hypothetical protein HDF24_02285 [Mucilaginibacter sp. X4EP1]|uniref:hypothetical protein n=1 Tax=Mucilaginibacter sp. X4EP1 TaxID=2723092 RepID=UPI002167619A|nr:hypothetical protein [Mucilaginibacter sp. X4EP1]MCS3811845.1 hypothetical protein [Mucilaginibacter sp. X4EP1]